jgi:hypothetical protein
MWTDGDHASFVSGWVRAVRLPPPEAFVRRGPTASQLGASHVSQKLTQRFTEQLYSLRSRRVQGSFERAATKP